MNYLPNVLSPRGSLTRSSHLALVALALAGCAAPGIDGVDGAADAPQPDARRDATAMDSAMDSASDAGALDVAADASAPDVASDHDAVDARRDAGAPDAARDAATGDACVDPTHYSDKPRAAGLMVRQGPPSAADHATYAFMDSTVVRVNWSDLQPTGPTDHTGPAWTTIQNALDAGWHVRLRVSAGSDAPDWVKDLGGPGASLAYTDNMGHAQTLPCAHGVGVYDPANNGTPGCIARFWDTRVQDAYAGLMALIAARWDDPAGGASNANLAEVVDGLCMTVFDEVFYRQHCQADSLRNMLAQGFTGALDLACQQRAVEIHATTFRHTRTSLSVNGWDWVDASGTCTRADQTRGEDFATWAGCRLGGLLGIQHNHLTTNDGCGGGFGMATDSCFISTWPGPRGFQTQTYSGLGGTPADLVTTLADGVSLRANFVELPTMWQTVPEATLASYDAMLRATPHP